MVSSWSVRTTFPWQTPSVAGTCGRIINCLSRTQRKQDLQGGETPWYIYRSAETYLMMAECYYWKGDNANATSMLNIVRARAGAEPLTGTIGIAEVLAERARELYYEENRHVELVRISYLYAKTGKACEAFGGRIYTQVEPEQTTKMQA